MTKQLDLSEIEAFIKGSGQGCGVGTILAGEEWRGRPLDPKDTEKFEAALNLSRFSNRSLSNWLKSKNVHLGESSINRHRNGGCRCGRS